MKYKILNKESKVFRGTTVYRIQALRDIKKTSRCCSGGECHIENKALDVQAGDKGGWIEDYNNLDQADESWLHGNATCMGKNKLPYNEHYHNDEVLGGPQMEPPKILDKHASIAVKKSFWESLLFWRP